jgi:RND superfamily putative drug exporter
VGLGALTLPAQDMRLALPDAGTAASGSPARESYDLISEGFGPGFNGRLIAVVTGDSAAATGAAATQAAQLIDATDGVLHVSPPQPNPQGTTVLMTVIPEAGPADAATEQAVHAIRERVAGIRGADIALTGATAIGIDVSAKLAAAMPVYLVLVAGLSILLLMLVFRSLLVPIKAALGFLLTVGATFGITVAIFQQGHLAGLVGVDVPGPLVSFLPILLIGILFGLAMDYEVFLVSRMREDFVHGDSPQQATVNGLGHNARVHGRPDHQVHRLRAGRRRARRRVRRPADPGAGRDVLPRPRGLVAAPSHRPHPARSRHRGREPDQEPERRPARRRQGPPQGLSVGRAPVRPRRGR